MFLALLSNTSCLFLLCSHLGEERAASFTLIVFLITRECYCAIAFSHCALGWSAVHDCGMSWSDSLIILVLSFNGLYILKKCSICRDINRKQWVKFCHKYLLPIVVYLSKWNLKILQSIFGNNS